MQGEEASQPKRKKKKKRKKRKKKKKKKERNKLLVFVLLPQQCPSSTKPVVMAEADLLLESLLPRQRARAGRRAAGGWRRLQELWGWWAPAPAWVRTGPQPFQGQHPAPCRDRQVTGVALPGTVSLTVAEGGSASGAGHKGGSAGCPLPHQPSVRAGSGLLGGWEELCRTRTFSKCSQREPGFPTNLVKSKLVSQIPLSLAEAASHALGCTTDF